MQMTSTEANRFEYGFSECCHISTIWERHPATFKATTNKMKAAEARVGTPEVNLFVVHSETSADIFNNSGICYFSLVPASRKMQIERVAGKLTNCFSVPQKRSIIK